MKKKLLVTLVAGMVAGACAWGQRSDTVYQTLFSNPTALGVSPLIRNVGQTNHAITMITRNNAPNVCPAYATPNTILRLQASYDNLVWFTAGVPITATRPSDTGVIKGTLLHTGTYPYLRTVLELADFVNCQYFVYYAGSVAGTFDPTLLAAMEQSYVTWTVAGKAIGASAINGPPTATLRTVLYGFSVTIPKGSVINVQLFDSTLGLIWDAGILGDAASTTSTTYTLPFTGKPYCSTQLNGLINVVFDAGCLTCGLSAIYRME